MTDIDLGALQKRVMELQELLAMAEAEAEKAISTCEGIEAELGHVKRTLLEQTAKLLGMPMNGTPTLTEEPPYGQNVLHEQPVVEPPAGYDPESDDPRRSRFGAFRSRGSA